MLWNKFKIFNKIQNVSQACWFYVMWFILLFRLEFGSSGWWKRLHLLLYYYRCESNQSNFHFHDWICFTIFVVRHFSRHELCAYLIIFLHIFLTVCNLNIILIKLKKHKTNFTDDYLVSQHVKIVKTGGVIVVLLPSINKSKISQVIIVNKLKKHIVHRLC